MFRKHSEFSSLTWTAHTCKNFSKYTSHCCIVVGQNNERLWKHWPWGSWHSQVFHPSLAMARFRSVYFIFGLDLWAMYNCEFLGNLWGTISFLLVHRYSKSFAPFDSLGHGSLQGRKRSQSNCTDLEELSEAAGAFQQRNSRESQESNLTKLWFLWIFSENSASLAARCTRSQSAGSASNASGEVHGTLYTGHPWSILWSPLTYQKTENENQVTLSHSIGRWSADGFLVTCYSPSYSILCSASYAAHLSILEPL